MFDKYECVGIAFAIAALGMTRVGHSPAPAVPTPTPTPVSTEVLSVFNTPEPVVEIPEPEPEPEPTMTLWGNCRVTAYCPCAQCCGEWALNRPIDEYGEPIVYGSAGVPLTSKYSCASSLPNGTKIYIPELDAEFVVQDRAADWIYQKYSGMYVDIYISDHQECFNYLSGHNDWMEVYVLK